MMSASDVFSWQMKLHVSAHRHGEGRAGKVPLKLAYHAFLLEVPSSMGIGNSSVASEGESLREAVASLWHSFLGLRIWLVMGSVRGAGWKGTLCRLRSWLVVGSV